MWLFVVVGIEWCWHSRLCGLDDIHTWGKSTHPVCGAYRIHGYTIESRPPIRLLSWTGCGVLPDFLWRDRVMISRTRWMPQVLVIECFQCKALGVLRGIVRRDC